jgi:hypothetical protein
MHWKGCRKQQSWLRQYPSICLEEVRTLRRNLTQDSQVFQRISKPDNSCIQGRSIVTLANMLVTSSSLVVILFQLIPFILKMRAVGSSKTPSLIYQTICCNIPEKCTLNTQYLSTYVNTTCYSAHDDDLPSFCHFGWLLEPSFCLR